MTTLAKDTPRTYELGDLNGLPMVATDIIYEGAAVGLSSGYARPLVAGDAFQGFAIQNADNASGSAGDVLVTVKTYGEARLSVGSLAITDVGKPVYASDDDTFTLTATSNSYVGKVKRYVSAGIGIVAFNVCMGGTVAALTDSTGGSTDGTLSDVGGTFSQATLNNNFAEVAAKINAMAAFLK